LKNTMRHLPHALPGASLLTRLALGLACSFALTACGSGQGSDKDYHPSKAGLSPISPDAQLVGDTRAPQWFGIGATGPVYINVYIPTEPPITIFEGKLNAGQQVRVGRRVDVVVQYSVGANLYYSLGNRVERATRAKLGNDPIPLLP
jgi:hypothetical protein